MNQEAERQVQMLLKAQGVLTPEELAHLIVNAVEAVIEKRNDAEIETRQRAQRDLWKRKKAAQRSVPHCPGDTEGQGEDTKGTETQKPEKSQVSAEKALVVSAVKGGLGGPLTLALDLPPSGSDSGLSKASSSGDRQLDGRRGGLHDEVLCLFASIFCEAKGADYVATAADRSQLGRLFTETKRAGWSSEDVLREIPHVFHAYLTDEDEFLERQGWSLKNFVAGGGFNKYRARAHSPPPASRRERDMTNGLRRLAEHARIEQQRAAAAMGGDPGGDDE